MKPYLSLFLFVCCAISAWQVGLKLDSGVWWAWLVPTLPLLLFFGVAALLERDRAVFLKK